ncbi:lysosome membrane protein 2c [Callorhinchus milii]|uniref:Lysosome membrane protein 2 n=1 Tax=Callorhinchus milii TaxID=7868 RepID=V9KAP1_CALMI|nr:lysosome membrane protein 2c [Callorhinchus milii]
MGLRSGVTYTSGIVCVALLIVSIALLVSNVFTELINSTVKKEFQLRNGTEAFKAWKNPPPPVYMQFYFFNVSNPAEVLAGGKPFLEERGPYTYREYRQKEDVTFAENGSAVSALTPKTYVFVPDMSVGDPKVDLISTVNIPAVTVMDMAQYSNLMVFAVKAILHFTGEGLFTTRTAHELLWGYQDPLLQSVHILKPDIDGSFGLFYKMNGTADGDYVILTGEENYMDFAKIIEWSGRKSLDLWLTDQCNMINGTDGTSFHPLMTKNETIHFFSSDLCRSLYATFEKELDVKGIPAYRFVPPSEVFANDTINPANVGFCIPSGHCLGSGVLNVSVCRKGAPIILSSPHFYQADQKYIDDIEGMDPNKENHETFLDINPLTGILLKVAKRLQINVYIEKIDVFHETGNVQSLIFPVMYLNESVLIDDSSASKLSKVLLETQVATVIPFMIMGLGILLGFIFIILVCTNRTVEKPAGVEPTVTERTPLLNPS